MSAHRARRCPATPRARRGRPGGGSAGGSSRRQNLETNQAGGQTRSLARLACRRSPRRGAARSRRRARRAPVRGPARADRLHAPGRSPAARSPRDRRRAAAPDRASAGAARRAREPAQAPSRTRDCRRSPPRPPRTARRSPLRRPRRERSQRRRPRSGAGRTTADASRRRRQQRARRTSARAAEAATSNPSASPSSRRRKVGQPAQRGLIRPVRVIDGQQQRPARGQIERQPVEAVHNGERPVGRAALGRTRRGAAGGPPPAGPASSDLALVSRRVREAPLEKLQDDAERETPPPAPTRERAGPVAARLGPPARRLDQRRLADPRRTLDHEQPPPPSSSASTAASSRSRSSSSCTHTSLRKPPQLLPPNTTPTHSVRVDPPSGPQKPEPTGVQTSPSPHRGRSTFEPHGPNRARTADLLVRSGPLRSSFGRRRMRRWTTFDVACTASPISSRTTVRLFPGSPSHPPRGAKRFGERSMPISRLWACASRRRDRRTRLRRRARADGLGRAPLLRLRHRWLRAERCPRRGSP